MRYKLLITDDDPSLLAIYKTITATIEDVDVDFASNPDTCRRLLRSGSYDLVMLDIYLTDNPDGLDILGDMWKHPFTDTVMMSTCDDKETVDTCNEMGANAFISKNHDFLSSFRKSIGLMKEKTADNTVQPFAAAANFC